ncbi:MAG: hypothetical protein ACYS1A_04330 [Planctomycetota bacterium]|jgi:hypothetical protein
MEHIQIGRIQLSRFILGSNPFSGFSHQGVEMDEQMKRYYSCERIKQTLAEAERLGIDTLIARTDSLILRVLTEYRDEGGKIVWFGQTCPEVGSTKICVQRASKVQAKACHIHGGVMDHLLAHNSLDEAKEGVKMIREEGMLAGIAGHRPEVFKWAEENVDVDYYMCSYYNPIPREYTAEHTSELEEYYGDEDREVMAAVIAGLSKPVVHYKIMAAGRNDPADAFAYTAKHMRDGDAVCVGVYTENSPAMLEEDVGLFEKVLQD